MLTTYIYIYIYHTHPTRKALKKPCGRSAQIFQLHIHGVAFRAAPLDFGLGDMWFESDVK